MNDMAKNDYYEMKFSFLFSSGVWRLALWLPFKLRNKMNDGTIHLFVDDIE